MLRLRTIEERTLGETPAGGPRPADPGGERTTRRTPWRSPPGQPPWARPALLAVACAAAVAYAWGSDNAYLEPFYGAAARSMAGSWHDFLFGAFDPAGTVTVDKLPGALWLQALSLRVLGFHVWAVVLPQIVEGVLTILVLYRAVRRLAGPVAGIVAAAVLAVSPVTVALNRGNVSDSLLILLTVLAADATSAALVTGRLRTLLLAGTWVGLAFQAKMAQAWLVWPALALAYLVAAPPRLRVRLGHVALAGAVTVAVSLSWMTAVSLVPAHERPYVDGSTNDSTYAQVFDYNGFGRLGGGHAGGAGTPAPFLLRTARTGTALNSYSSRIGRSWHRLLSGLFGRDDGWLLPAALLAAVGVLLERRGAGRRDPVRAAVVLWSTWLAVLGVAFSDGVYLNSYYVAALSPATGALCGIGAAVWWRRRERPVARAMLAGVVLACTGYGIYLLHDATAVPRWLATAALAVGLAGAVAALTSPRLRGAAPAAHPVAAAVVASALLLPAVASVATVARNVDPFTAPFEPGATAVGSISVAQRRSAIRAVVARLSATYRTPIAFATDTSSTAATYIYYTGREILPIGGFRGGVPAPTLARLRQYIAAGELRAFLIPIAPPGEDPRLVWVRAHCAQSQRLPRRDLVQLAIYSCARTAADAHAGASDSRP